jgi:hypothetical protein
MKATDNGSWFQLIGSADGGVHKYACRSSELADRAKEFLLSCYGGYPSIEISKTDVLDEHVVFDCVSDLF